MIVFHLFFLCARPFDQKSGSSLIYFFNLYTTIRPKLGVTAKNGNFCDEFLGENDFEATLATFCCYEHGAKASEAVQRIAADQKEYRKCSSCVIIC